MNIIGHKKLYFLLSAIVIVPGLISLLLWGLKFGIDFTGGSRLEFQITNSKFQIPNEQIRKAVGKDANVGAINIIAKNGFLVQTNPLSQAQKIKVEDDLKKQFPTFLEKSFQTVGPTIGAETETNAVKAVIIASIAITVFIAYAFRRVSRPVSSWKFGVCAIAALLHDVLVVVGIFSILGHFAQVQVDSLFITALLTVMGFSVHDTIVVFDRIRENLVKHAGLPFEEIVNRSMLETLNRSLNTSLTVLVVLFSLLLFGGESIKWFIVALFIGVLSGTYSSIFNASPLLVLWNELDRKRSNEK